ncbi:MAG: 5'-methylthioadenosine/adenosylhomocysteine nucleosidase [Lachnospiraceae bacterium]|nr:5'-methylthioadenosine/adenosylhomocysteine nucleosidase [Lachnospiraceae bacterium]
MLGIIGAMEVEVARLKEAMEQLKVHQKAGMEFYKGKLAGCEAVVVRSGVGKVNAAVCAQILIDDFSADRIVNTGIAGSLQDKIDIGDLVISSDTLEHDMDATGFGYAPGVIPQMDCSTFAADEGLIALARECCGRVNPDIHAFVGRIVSGDAFISDKEKKAWLSETFHGMCTEMEGAAIAHTAYLNQVPFLIIRAISDKADDSARMDYPEFEKQAVEHSVNLMLALAQELA